MSPSTDRLENWELYATRNMSFWHQTLSCEGSFHHSCDFGAKVPFHQLDVTIAGTQTHVFIHQPNEKDYSHALLASLNTAADIDRLKHSYVAYAEKLLVALTACEQELSVSNWLAFLQNYRVFCAGLTLTATLGRIGSEALTEKLRVRGLSDAEIPDAIATMTYPSEHTPLFLSQQALLSLGAEIQKGNLKETAVEEALNRWLNAYAHIPVNFCDEPWSMSDARSQLDGFLSKNCSEELTASIANNERLIHHAASRLAEINDPAITLLAHALATGTSLNEFRKNVFSRVSLGYRPLFQEMARRSGSSTWRDIFYLTHEETTMIVRGEHVPVRKLKAERQIVAIEITDDGVRRFVDPERTRAFAEYIRSVHGAPTREKTEAVESFKGFSANKGVVRGIVKVVMNSSEFHKIHPGDILVTAMTSVDFVPVMEKAGAFVTNEGGVTSHASIVSREMNKPCIIGTKIATQVLKDGDEVEVNADEGIVKILRRV